MLWRAKIAKDERGATAIEYGLIAALVALGMLEGLSGLSDGVAAMWAEIVHAIQDIVT